VASGGVEAVASGGVASGATVLSGGTLSGPGAIAGATTDAGKVIGATVSGTLTVASGGVASALTVSAGATIIDDGDLVFSGATAVTYAGALSGSGMLVEAGTGALVLSGAAAAFTGELALSGGTAELATAAGVGGGAIVWASTTSATLKIDAADAPHAGATFSSTLSNFDKEYDVLDLTQLAFVSGATAVLSGSTLVVTDGGGVYDFQLAGTAAATYSATSDGSGGTLVKASTTTQVPAAQVLAGFIQAMAAFGAESAATNVADSTRSTPGIASMAAHIGSAAAGPAFHGG
jgi:autotransporter passenger strand-loop-strand repeat protein